MRLAFRTTWLAALIPLLALVALLSGCGALRGGAGTYTGAPDAVKIVASSFQPPTPTTIPVNDAATAQRLYHAAVSLPVAPTRQACPDIAGPRYEMTFQQQGRSDEMFVADRGGCGDVTLAQHDVRQADAAFWQTLERIVFDFSPPIQASKLEIVRFAPTAKPTIAVIPSAQAAQALYNAARALPPQRKDQACPALVGPRSELIFFAGDQRFRVTADKSGCGSVKFMRTSDVRQPDAAFWSLLATTAGAVQTAEARPAHLSVKSVPVSADPNGVAAVAEVHDAALIARLYDVTLALPPLTGQPACATRSPTLYGLAFELDDLSLLTAVTDQAGCAAVTLNEHDQRATTAEFWTLARQAIRSSDAPVR
jgi:hypothetical protein